MVLDSSSPDSVINAGYLSKLMTLLLIAEDIETGKFRLETELTASQTVYGMKGSVVWLEPGDKMTVDELLKSLIIGNANDAAAVLAEASEHSTEAFVSRMNSEAFDLGLRNTAFYSPYGFYDEREHTTAYELALICAELSKYDTLTPYFQTWRDFVKEGKTELVNENTLSRTYERHIGFKESHSEHSGYCIAEAGRDENGTVFIAVVLGAEDSDSAESTARKLIRSGFTDYKVIEAAFPEEFLIPLKVLGGEESAVMLSLRGGRLAAVPKSNGELTTITVLPEYINAPVAAGQVVGETAFYSGKTLAAEVAIVTRDSINALTYLYTLKDMLAGMLK